MLRLTLRTLRYRKGGFVATFIALFFGAAIVMACGGLMETGVRTAIPPHRLAGADVVVTADKSTRLATNDVPDEDGDIDYEYSRLVENVALDSAVLGKIKGVSGVTGAVPDVSFPATLAGSAPSTGHNWESARLGAHTITGEAPRSGQIVVPAASGRQPGDKVGVTVRGTTTEYTVSGVGTFAQPVMFFADDDAQRLGKLMAIGVAAAPGTDVRALADRLQDTLGTSVAVLTGEERGWAEYPAAEETAETVITLAAVFGGFAVTVSMLVVASTFGVSIQQRKREIALLRAVGTTPGQIRRMIFSESLIVSVLATMAAWLPAGLLGEFLFERLAAHGVADGGVEFHQGWIPSVTGAGTALLAGVVAAMAGARRASRTRPTEALAEAAIQRKWLTPTRLILAIVSCAGGLALGIVSVTAMSGPIAASTAGPAVLCWAIGFTLLAPGATKGVMALLRVPIRAMTKVPGTLAANNTKVRAVKLAAAVAPVMLASGFAFAQIYTQTTSTEASQRAYTEDLRADAVLVSRTGGFSPDVVESVRSTPGVAAASEWVTSTGFVDKPYDSELSDDGLPLQGVTASGAKDLTAVPVTSGSLADLSGRSIALPVDHAEAMSVKIGDRITMRFGDNRTEDVTVVATTKPKQGFDAALVPARLLAEHTSEGVATQIMVRAAGDPAQLPAALAGRFPDAQVADRTALTAAYTDGLETQAMINYLLAGMIVLYTAISVINTLVVETSERRREFGLLQLSGAHRGQVLRMVGVESAAIALTGVILGTIVSAGTLVPFSLAALDSVIPAGPIWIFLVVSAIAGVLTMAATIIPTWIALKAKPVDTVTVQ